MRKRKKNKIIEISLWFKKKLHSIKMNLYHNNNKRIMLKWHGAKISSWYRGGNQIENHHFVLKEHDKEENAVFELVTLIFVRF